MGRLNQPFPKWQIFDPSKIKHLQTKNSKIDTYKMVDRLHDVFNPFPLNDTFWRPWETSFLKTLWEKEKLLVMSNFSFAHSVFYPFRDFSAIFIKFKIASADFSIWTCLKFCHLVMGLGRFFFIFFNNFSVVSRWRVHLSIPSCGSFNQYSTQYSFKVTGCFPT